MKTIGRNCWSLWAEENFETPSLFRQNQNLKCSADCLCFYPEQISCRDYRKHYSNELKRTKGKGSFSIQTARFSLGAERSLCRKRHWDDLTSIELLVPIAMNLSVIKQLMKLCYRAGLLNETPKFEFPSTRSTGEYVNTHFLTFLSFCRSVHAYFHEAPCSYSPHFCHNRFRWFAWTSSSYTFLHVRHNGMESYAQ